MILESLKNLVVICLVDSAVSRTDRARTQTLSPPSKEKMDEYILTNNTITALGMYYQGCFRDAFYVQGGYRDVYAFSFKLTDNSPKVCYDWCFDVGQYEVAAVQYGKECYCDDNYGMFGQIAEGFCNSPCPGDEDLMCGGSWANSVYTKNRGDYDLIDIRVLRGHLGCYKDSSDRDLDAYSMESSALSIQYCIDTCKSRGYRYAGVQYKKQCFCGNSYGKHGSLQISDCNQRCSGRYSETCGGSYANNVYDVNYSYPSSGVCNDGSVSTRRCEGDLFTDDCPSGKECFVQEEDISPTGRLTTRGFCCPEV